MNEKHRKLTKLAVTALLAAAALAMSFFESALTAGLPLPPGVKPGFSNIAVLFACAALELTGALFLALIKAGFALLVSGAAAGFLSLCGGVFSVLAMFLLLRLPKKRLSYMGISAVSAVVHNLGQLIGASLLTGSALYLSWLPVLLISGVVFGAVTGVVLNVVMPALTNARFLQ